MFYETEEERRRRLAQEAAQQGMRQQQSTQSLSASDGIDASQNLNTREYLQGVFDGKVPFETKDTTTGQTIQKYSKWNNETEELEDYTPKSHASDLRNIKNVSNCVGAGQLTEAQLEEWLRKMFNY